MDIYLIRHTRTNTVQGLCYGQSDVQLASTFEDEAQTLSNKIPPLSTDCLVISSPLNRCLLLAQTFQRKIITDQRLQEMSFGDWENQFFDDIDEAQLKHWADNFVTISPPNGENFTHLCQRVADFWCELLATKPAEQIVLITHAGVIRALLTEVLKLLPEHSFHIRVDFGSVHKLQHSNDYTYVHYLNL